MHEIIFHWRCLFIKLCLTKDHTYVCNEYMIEIYSQGIFPPTIYAYQWIVWYWYISADSWNWSVEKFGFEFPEFSSPCHFCYLRSQVDLYYFPFFLDKMGTDLSFTWSKNLMTQYLWFAYNPTWHFVSAI